MSTFEAGLTEIGEMPHAIVCMHLGPSVEVRCTRGGTVREGPRSRGRPRHHSGAHRRDVGDEAGRHGAHHVRARRAAARGRGRGSTAIPASIDIADRFQMRDPVIEHIGWTIKADIDSNLAGGRLLRDSLGVALAARLLQRHYRGSLPMREVRGGLTHTKLERVIAHIEDNLASKLSLPGIAEVAGMSVSHLKTLFRNSTGVPVYEYVLRRRVERAQLLLRNHQALDRGDRAGDRLRAPESSRAPHAPHPRLHAFGRAPEARRSNQLHAARGQLILAACAAGR